MKKGKHLKGIALLLILPLVLMACAGKGDEEPGAAALPAEEETGGAPRATAGPTHEADNTPTPLLLEGEPSATGAADESEADSGRATIIVTPVTVDLGDVTPATTPESEEAVEMPVPGVPDPAQTMAGKATSDLAQYLNVDPGAIEVVSIEAVEWPDSSLGCPRPGQSYLTVITPGFKITLQVHGREFEYHTDREDRVIRCDTHPGGNESDSS